MIASFTTRDAPAVDVITRLASFVPSTMQGNTVEAILSTSADVQRSGYIERLGEWGTLPDRIPLLDSHRRDSVDYVIGFVDQIRNDNGVVRGVVHISDARPDVRQKIADGSISGTSIGFTAQWRDQTENGRRFRVADSITLREASLVVIAADGGARLRSLAAAVGVSESFTSQLATRGLSDDQQRSAVIAEAARSQVSIDTRARVTQETSPAAYARAMGEALAVRHGAGNTPSELARPFVNERFPAMVRRWSELSNLHTTGMSEATIVRQAMTTSDFPLMLGEFAHITVLRAYQNAPAPILDLTRRTTAADFRDIHALRLGDNPALLEIPESGEIKFGELGESGESIRLKRWGRGLAISYVLMVNDQLGTISDALRTWGFSVKETEANCVASLLAANAGLGPVMSDGKKLFDVTHGNVAATGGAISEITLDAGRQAMRKQKTKAGNPVSAAPRYLLVPVELETVAKKETAAVSPTEIAAVNPFSDLSPLVEVRLKNATRWYLFADPDVLPCIVRAYLSGEEGPRTESTVDFHTDNQLVKTTLSFGCGVIDYTGAYSNAGA